jgi:hypothetical protein
MPLKVPALLPDIFGPFLSDTGLTAQDVRALFRDPDWQSLESQNQRVTFLVDFARCNCCLGLSNQLLARVFDISPQHVAKIHWKARKLSKPPHRPVTLDENQDISVLEFIRSGFSLGNYLTQREVLSSFAPNFRKIVAYGWVSSFLDLWSNRITRTVVSPREQPRRQIPRGFLDDYIALIQAYVHSEATQIP